MKKSLILCLLIFTGCARHSGANLSDETEFAAQKSANSNQISANSEPNSNANSDFDPLYPYNVAMTYANDAIYSFILDPLAAGYDFVVPDPIQGAVSDFFHNLAYPIRLVNNLLQGKFEDSWVETKRFFINSTLGFAGMSDAAKLHFDLNRSDEDFGQTLGSWGLGGGFPIVLPILGQTNLRDAVGFVADSFANPITYTAPQWHRPYVINGIKAFNEHSIVYEDLMKFRRNSGNLYENTKNFYEQNRNEMIKK